MPGQRRALVGTEGLQPRPLDRHAGRPLPTRQPELPGVARGRGLAGVRTDMAAPIRVCPRRRPGDPRPGGLWTRGFAPPGLPRFAFVSATRFPRASPGRPRKEWNPTPLSAGVDGSRRGVPGTISGIPSAVRQLRGTERLIPNAPPRRPPSRLFFTSVRGSPASQVHYRGRLSECHGGQT